MKPEEQVRALAELDGFIEIGEKPFGKSELRWMGLHKNAGCPSEWWDLPKYLTSYDAILPVMQKQPSEIQWKALRDIHKTDSSYPKTFSMTPAEICEALLKATNRWTE
jgi:hypothetical protein